MLVQLDGEGLQDHLEDCRSAAATWPLLAREVKAPVEEVDQLHNRLLFPPDRCYCELVQRVLEQKLPLPTPVGHRLQSEPVARPVGQSEAVRVGVELR